MTSPKEQGTLLFQFLALLAIDGSLLLRYSKSMPITLLNIAFWKMGIEWTYCLRWRVRQYGKNYLLMGMR